MNKELLINTVSKLLGVSSSEKEFAFQIFLEKTAEVLGKDEALKYPDLGFFYFKENGPGLNESEETLQYVPIHNSAEVLDDNFFLSFDVKRKNRNSMDFDPSVFSLSIDKTTIPFEIDKGHNTDISYHLLKKTIEERVEELIASAVHIENFKMLDTLFTENSIKEEYVPTEEKDVFDLPRDTSYEEMIFSRMDYDEVGDSVPSEKLETDDKSFESVVEPPDIEPVIKEETPVEIVIPGTGLPDDISDFDFLDLKNKKEEVEWAWTEKDDENETVNNISIKDDSDAEVVPAGPPPAETDDPFEELQKTIDEEIKTEEVVTEEAAAEVNTTDAIPAEEKIIPETRDEVSIIQNESTIENEEHKMTEENQNTPVEENNLLSEDDSSQKRNIILICAMVIIALVAVYIIFFNGFGLMKKNNTAPQPAKTEQAENQPGETKDSLKTAETGSAQKPASGYQPAVMPAKGDAKKASKTEPASKTDTKYQKLKESAEGTLLREMKNDNKVGSNIYTDGTKFYVQVSSWKNIAKAEEEAKKMKAKGHDAFIVKAYIEQFKGTWYRVRVGSFNTKADAEAFSSKIK
jgi:cell division septation protein DedD